MTAPSGLSDREIDERIAVHVFGLKPGVDFWDLPDHDFKPGGEHDRCGYSESLGYGEYSTCPEDVEACARCGETKCAAQHNHLDREVAVRCVHPLGSWLSIEGAFAVVKAMRARGYRACLDCASLPATVSEPYYCCFARADLSNGRSHSTSLPRAICLAALAALDVSK